MKKVAILTMDSLEEFECYDRVLDKPMQEAGWHTTHVPWKKSDVNWNSFDVVVIRSTWDYQNDPDKFFSVIESIDASSARLENSINLVRWNINKSYLKELESKGILIVPSLWFGQFSLELIKGSYQKYHVDEIVIKPLVSANADNTFRLDAATLNTSIKELEKIFSSTEFVVQPFIKSVVEKGEYSVFYFNEIYSHCILKTPKKGDFRVQEEHGGVLTSIKPHSDLLEASQKVLNALPEMPLYARVDLVEINGGFALMEVELIEPSLYFNMDTHSAERFVSAFVERCG